jgi:uncharacterized NAD(P)/FAD-binding protein YdhS
VRNLVTEDEAATEPIRVVIVGGGAAGVIIAVHLLRDAGPERCLDVRIVEKDAGLGPGLAYRTTHHRHTLNNYAGRLSALDGDPDHLLRWCRAQGATADPTSFLPRNLYGRYLASVLDDAVVPAGSMLRRDRGVVTDVRDDAGGLSVHLASGWSVPADEVVLALGNPPPRPHPDLSDDPRFLADPWAADLPDLVSDAREVLLLGTGLTMVDVVARLHEARPGARFTAVSRHGLLPAAHRRSGSHLHGAFTVADGSLDAILDSVRLGIRELEGTGGDWRDVVDTVRAHANELWAGLTPAEQDRFVVEVSRYWETARHRMSPDMAAYVERLRQEGILRVATVADVDASRFDRVVGCTGPAPLATPGWNPLVDALLRRGLLRSHRLGLGLDLDTEGRLLDGAGRAHPHLYAVGAARRGVEWEVAAIPDLRSQAARLSATLLDAAPRQEVVTA